MMSIETVPDAGRLEGLGWPHSQHADRTAPHLYEFSRQQYHRMGEAGILAPDARVELLEGKIIQMSPIGPAHAYTTQTTCDIIAACLPAGWVVRMQSPITLDNSEPEPDGAVVRGSLADYKQRHPTADKVGLVIETSDSSLEFDRNDKGAIYALACIPCYWIINLLQRQMEVYTDPRPAGNSSPPQYAKREVFPENDTAPLILDGKVVARLLVSNLLP